MQTGEVRRRPKQASSQASPVRPAKQREEMPPRDCFPLHKVASRTNRAFSSWEAGRAGVRSPRCCSSGEQERRLPVERGPRPWSNLPRTLASAARSAHVTTLHNTARGTPASAYVCATRMTCHNLGRRRVPRGRCRGDWIATLFAPRTRACVQRVALRRSLSLQTTPANPPIGVGRHHSWSNHSLGAARCLVVEK